MLQGCNGGAPYMLTVGKTIRRMIRVRESRSHRDGARLVHAVDIRSHPHANPCHVTRRV